MEPRLAAFDRSFEGALAACGAPIVGLLAEKLFGFEVSSRAASAHLKGLISALEAARHQV